MPPPPRTAGVRSFGPETTEPQSPAARARDAFVKSVEALSVGGFGTSSRWGSRHSGIGQDSHGAHLGFCGFWFSFWRHCGAVGFVETFVARPHAVLSAPVALCYTRYADKEELCPLPTSFNVEA